MLGGEIFFGGGICAGRGDLGGVMICAGSRDLGVEGFVLGGRIGRGFVLGG